MPVIRITQRTWERLKKHATPLVHTANDVVEMALEALEGQARKRGTLVHAREFGSAKKKSSRPRRELGHSLSSNFELPCLMRFFDKMAERTAEKFVRSWSRRWHLCSVMRIMSWSPTASLAGGIRYVRCATSS